MAILGIETSCDETAAALVTDDGEILSNVVASQAELHARYGGVVPEIASRRHLELIVPVLEEALTEEPTAIAVTTRPGLIGALLVGVSAAKALAWARRLPLIPVNHLHGHVASLYLQPLDLEPPFICLLASGGHTMLLDVRERAGYTVLGTTLDDAAGEAFDKGARLLGLGYPGGREIDRLAARGRPGGLRLPGRPGPGPRLLVLRAEDRAALRGPGADGRGARRRAAPTWPRATSGRSSARSSSGSRRPEATGSPSSAASRRTPSSARRCPTPRSRRCRSAPTTRR